MLVPDEDIRGRTVIAADGQLVGEVTAFLIDTDDWLVQALQIELRKEIADQLGTHRSIFRAGTLQIPMRVVQSVGRTIILSVPVEGLRAVLPSEAEQKHAHG
jgi:sporulation protein YlmC with PRC-barrel domain